MKALPKINVNCSIIIITVISFCNHERREIVRVMPTLKQEIMKCAIISLLQYVVDHIRQHTYIIILLTTQHNNKAAISLYCQASYHHAEHCNALETIIYTGDITRYDIVMNK